VDGDQEHRRGSKRSAIRGGGGGGVGKDPKKDARNRKGGGDKVGGEKQEREVTYFMRLKRLALKKGRQRLTCTFTSARKNCF